MKNLLLIALAFLAVPTFGSYEYDAIAMATDKTGNYTYALLYDKTTDQCQLALLNNDTGKWENKLHITDLKDELIERNDFIFFATDRHGNHQSDKLLVVSNIGAGKAKVWYCDLSKNIAKWISTIPVGKNFSFIEANGRLFILDTDQRLHSNTQPRVYTVDYRKEQLQ